jgi:tetratricopeptide (TPR) repeat protein
VAAAAAPRPSRLRSVAARVLGRGRFRRLFRAALLFIAFAMVANEISVGSEAGQLIGALPTVELDRLPDAWVARDKLVERSFLGFGTFGVDRAISERSEVLANRVIADYRMPSPTVREAQWQKARDVLARAVSLSPGDRELRAELRYCEGHLHRINGEARKDREQAGDAQHELNEAVASFREAAELRPKWPDPFLGLVRTFIYGLEDVDRAADALKQAQQSGYTPSERDLAQLADGYRARGNVLVRNARGLAGLPQERDYLSRAADAYRQALALYPKAGTFANVPGNIRLTQRALDQVQRRIDELSAAPAGPAAPAGETGTVALSHIETNPGERATARGSLPWA